MSMGQMRVVTLFLLKAAAVGSSGLRDPPGPSYMSHAGAAEELAEKRHLLGIAKGKFLADIYNECTVKYRDAKHIADLVKEKAGLKVSGAEREATVFDQKVSAATKADNVKDPVSGESPKMKWMDHRDNKKAEVVFFKQIISNANTVNKDGARGLKETTDLRKKVEGEFDDLDKWVVPKEAQSDDAERVIEDARKLWKQWTDSSKDYNCGIVQPVDHAKTQCKKGNTKFGIKCAVVCVPGYDDPNDSKNNLRCRKEGKFGKQLYGEWKGMATCVGRMCGLPAKIEKAKTVIQKIRYPHKATYNCYAGFSQDGNATGSKAFEVPCSTTGNFDQASSHVCKPVKCGEAPIMAGTEKVAGTFYFSNILNYTCKVGHTLDETAGGLTSFTTSCQATGRFSQGQACKRVRCGTAPDYDSTTAKRVGDKAQVCARSEGKACKCNGVVHFGRKFVSGKPGSGKTTLFEQLKASPFKQKQIAGEIMCDIQSMGGDPFPGYYKWCYCQQAVEKKYGDQVDYTCNRGYSLNQKASGKQAFALTCGADGEFNLKGSAVPSIPQCRPVSAGILPLVKYGNAKQREMFFGQSVVVTAETGYSTSGKPTVGLSFLVAVSHRGFFVGVKEFIPVICGAPPTVKKAKTSFAKPKGVYGNILNYACEDGYSTDKSDSEAAKTFSVQCESDADFSRVPNLGYCTNIDDCVGHSCGPHGSCVDHLMNYTCKCDSGFEQWQNNETNELVCGNINDCGAEACGVGKCKDLVNGFDCICPTGFEVVGEDEEKTCKPVECGNPPGVNNGATAPVDAADNKAIYKDKVMYQCDAGYTLDGSFPAKNQFSIDCQSNKRFTAKKSCNPVKCGGAPTIEHASKRPGTATYNDTIRYTCKDGYTIDGTPKGDGGFSLTCLANAQYSDTQKCRPVNCGEPGDAANSNRPDGSLTYKQSATYKCFEGFTLNGKKSGKTEFKVTCHQDGSLDKLKDCLPKVCGIPHKRINAMHATTADEGAVAYPRSTQVTCRPGYTVGGSPAGNTSFNVACLSSGDFEEYDKRECDPVRCSAPPPMPNATLDRVWSPHKPAESKFLNYEEKAFYKCKPGFSVGGEPSAPKTITVECLPSGQISAPPDDMQCRNIDDCERHTCGPKGTCIDLIGPSPAYTCKCEFGFDLRTKPNGEKHCGNTDDCKDQDCGEGVCKDLVGDYTCICPSGYYIGKKAGVKTCVPIRCAANTPSLSHGSQTTSHSGAIDFPTTLQYKCDKGYSIDGTVAASKRKFQAQCKPSGQMAGMMSCQKISCGSPYVLSFTSLVSPASARKSIEYGEEVKYKCFDGYTIKKNGRGEGPREFKVTCPDNGVLTDPETCEPVLCGSAPHVSHGHASVGGDVFYGMHLEYMCHAGYTSQNTKFQRRCQKDGTFSALPSDKPCKPVSGGRAPTIQNAAMTEYAGRPVSGSQPEIFYPNGVEYKCNAGYSENGAPSGPTKLSSRVNSLGQLSPALPVKCVRITFVIKGLVKDARNGRSLAGASVSIQGNNQRPQVCALGEGAACTCTGVVHYGKKYVSGKPGSGQTTSFDQLKASPSKQKSVAGAIACSSGAMGGDPLGGYYKWCYCEQAAATLNGLFALTGLGGGSVTLKYQRSGYIDNVKTFNIRSNINTGGAADVSMSPKMANDQWRAVVKWKRTPSDLDTYAKWSNTKVCYYSTSRRSVGMQGRLEKDDTNGYGPETVYFTGVGSCRASDNNCYIRYIINDYTRSGRMKDISGAQVTLYTGDRVAGTWTIEGCKNTVSTNGNWWHVFTLDGKRNQLKWNCNSGPEFPANPGYLSLAHFGPPKPNTTKLVAQLSDAVVDTLHTPNATKLVAQLSDAVVDTLHTNSTSQSSTVQALERQQEQQRLQLERQQAKDKKEMELKQAKDKKDLERREAKSKKEADQRRLKQAKDKKEADTKRKNMVAAIAALRAAGMEELEKEATAKLAAFDLNIAPQANAAVPAHDVPNKMDVATKSNASNTTSLVGNSSSTPALKPQALLQEPNGVRMHLRSWSKAHL